MVFCLLQNAFRLWDNESVFSFSSPHSLFKTSFSIITVIEISMVHFKLPFTGIHILVTPNPLENLSLYSIGPFFGAPHKFWMNAQLGTTFEDAYERFEADHRGTFNILAHAGCMVFQLFMNFHFLEIVSHAFGKNFRNILGTIIGKDNYDKIAPALSLSFLTMMMWISLVWLPQPSQEVTAKVCASVSIFVAFLTRKMLMKEWDTMAFLIGGFCDSLIYPILVFHRPFNPLESIAFFVARSLFYTAVFYFKGNLSSSTAKLLCNATVCITIVFACLLEDVYNPPMIFIFGLLAWIPALVTNQPTLYYLSCGFVATLMQGVTHEIAGESPTMPGLRNISHEYAHATFFPVMLWRVIIEKFFA